MSLMLSPHDPPLCPTMFRNSEFRLLRRCREKAAPTGTPLSNEVQYIVSRTNIVQQHFPSALAMDDFACRMEMLLGAHGFYGDNTIGE